MTDSRFTVETDDQYVRILYDNREVLYWHQDEWVEDPTLVAVICEAIRQAYEEPERVYRRLVDLGIL